MNGGIAQLRHEVESLDQALRAFDAPVALELPGLRLMRRVLEDRRDQVIDKLRDTERCKLVVAIDHHGRPEDGVPAVVIAGITDALQRAVRALAHELVQAWDPVPGTAVVDDEVELYLVSWTTGTPAEATLQFLRGPEEQLADPATEIALVETVLEALVAAVDGGPRHAALVLLAQIVVDHAISLDLTAVLTGGASNQARLDRATAQRIVRA